MSAKGLEVIDHTVQLTHEWVNELAARLGWSSPKDALRLLRATLVEVRDRLGHEEIANFAAQLPLLIRGAYYEGWKPSATPVKDRHLDSFLGAIESKVGAMAEYRGAEDVVAVFKLLNARISQGEIDDIRASLPEGIRNLWPA